MTKKIISIQNSWLMNQMRFHCHQHDFKDWYFDRVLSLVLQEVPPGKDVDIEVFFNDNFVCNAMLLDIEKLKIILLNLYKSVSFVSDNPFDHMIDLKNYAYRPSIVQYWNDFLKLSLASKTNSTRDIPKKYFGLHVLRPDTHRLALILELHRRDLLSYVDVRLGMNLEMLVVDEFRRSTNIDMVCWYYDISFKDFIDILEKLPRGSLDSFAYKKNNPEIMLKNDVLKALLFDDFLIDIVCDSKINDFVPCVSEKHFRPLINKNPFIILGPRNSYIELKKICGGRNLKSFDHLWDESWDDLGAEFLKDKISGIVNSCQHIVETFTIKDLQVACQDIVEYNFSQIVDLNFCEIEGMIDPIVEISRERYPDFFNKNVLE